MSSSTRRSRTPYSAMVEQAGDAFFVHDDEGHILDVNPKACAMLGQTRAALLTKTIQEIDPDLSDPSAKKPWTGIKAGGQSTFETRLIRKDGGTVPVEVTLTALRLPEGQLFMGIVRDISERKQQDSSYRQLIEGMNDAAHVVDLSGRFLAVNERATEMLGYSREEFLAMGPADIDLDKSLVGLDHIISEVVSGRPQVVETLHQAKDGKVIPVEIGLSPVSYQGQIAVLGVVRDVTTRRRAEESSRALSRRMQAILQTIPDIVAEVDENKVYTWVNEAGLRFFGDDVVGKEAAHYFADEQNTYAAVRPLFNGDADTRYVESWQRRLDGENRLLAWWCRSLRDDTGQVTGALSTARDITESWYAETLRDARLRLLESAHTSTVEDFLAATLAELEGLTYSRIAFCKSMAPGQEAFCATVWAALDIEDSCRIKPRDTEHVLDEAGLWADCIKERRPMVFNDYKSLSRRKGTPPGHTELKRLLTVPMFRADEVVAVFAVANKVTEYTQRDVDTVSLFADLAWDTAARMQAEAALQESDALNRRLVDCGPDSVILSEPGGHFLDCNQTAVDTYGYSREEFLQMTYRDLAAPSLRDRAGTHVSETLEQGGTVFEWRHRRKDGSELPVEIRTTPFMAHGKQRIMATVRDLTVSKAAENALQQSEERFKSLASMTSEGIMIHESGIVVDANRAFAELCGYNDADELIGRPGMELLPATEESRRELIKHMRTADSETFTIQLEKPDGAILWVETRGREVMYRGRRARLVFMRDITEHRRADEALRRSEQEFRALFEAAPVGIGAADQQGNLLAFNEAMLSPGGYSRQDIERVGNVSALYYDPEERDAALRLFHEQGFLHQHETAFKRKDGTPYEVWLSLTRTTFNGVPCVLAIVEDRTEKKRAEDERERLQTQLRQAAKMESIGRLAGGVAHDFNNMLAVILGHVELALDQVPEEHDLYTDLQEIRKAADRSASITQQLLAFARRQVAVPKVVDLNKAVEGMMGMLRRLIGEQVDLVWLPGPGPNRVQIDPSQLDQVLVNLCLNARDAIVDSGRVSIRTADLFLDEKRCEQREGCTPGDYILLSVRDDGPGMSKDALDHLFEPFFTTKATGKGTGLGLATVYGIVRQNNGFIEVDTDTDHGTEVRIYLPCVDAEITDHNRVDPLSIPSGGHETILVVEDELSVLTLTQRILTNLDYTVLTAQTPNEALHIAEEHPTEITLAITDIVMPQMNGWELAKRLLVLRPGLKLLYVSGYTDQVPSPHTETGERINFLQKPFALQDLAAAVRAALDQ